MHYVNSENFPQTQSFYPGDTIPEGQTLIAVVTADHVYFHGPDNYTHQSGFVDYDWSCSCGATYYAGGERSN